MTNQYLNYRIEKILVEELDNYISNCIDNQYILYNEKINADDDDADEVIDDLIFKMFNDFQDGLNFGEYAGDEQLGKYIIKLIQYSNNYYNENGGELIDWKDFDNVEKIINNAGYVFVNDNRRWFIETWNRLIYDAGVCIILK